jgi:thioredoxin-like negative regulator of GroEL
MNEHLEKAKKLMEQHRFEEAAKPFADFLQSDEFLDEQAGEAYLSLITAYMAALIRARQDYNQALDVGISLLRASKKREQEIKEGIDLAVLNHQIKALQG